MTPNPRPKSRKLARLVLKLAIGLVVVLAAGRHAAQTWSGLHDHGIVVRAHAGWLVAAAAAYLAGLTVDGVWYGRILRRTATPVAFPAAIRAYLISHLGKYVPGKALVVVMRVALVVPAGARPATAAFATLYETLVMMAAGGLVALLVFLAIPRGVVPLGVGGLGPWEVPLAAVGAMFACGFLVLTWPAVFGRLTRLISLPFPSVGPDAWPRISPWLPLEGLLWTTLGWLCLGLSQVAVLYGVGYRELTVSAGLAAVGSVALATVAGFVVPVAPGGLGVREWVLWTSLGAALDHEWAVVASLALRLVWVVAELLAAAVLVSWARPVRRAPTATENSTGRPISPAPSEVR